MTKSQDHVVVTNELLGKGGFGDIFLSDLNGRNATAKVPSPSIIGCFAEHPVEGTIVPVKRANLSVHNSTCVSGGFRALLSGRSLCRLHFDKCAIFAQPLAHECAELKTVGYARRWRRRVDPSITRGCEMQGGSGKFVAFRAQELQRR